MTEKGNEAYPQETIPRRSAQHVKKKRLRTTRIVIRIGLCICAAAFIVGGVIVGKTLIEDNKADKAYSDLRRQTQNNAYTYSISDEALQATVETAAPGSAADVKTISRPSMDFAPLKEINTDIVAWLTSEGTVIDYPVLHTDNNDFYLNHLYTKESNRSGSLFMDYRNTGLFTDRNTVIYGHNMRDGAMFNTLAEYKAQDYYDAVPTMTLYTPDGDYTIELFAGTVEDGNYEFVQFEFGSDEAFLKYVDDFRTRSTFQSDVVVEPTDRIVTLCTCSYERNNARYIVIGRLVQR